MTVDAVLVPVQPGGKKAGAVVGGSSASQGEAGQLFAAMLGQWLYALEGAQGQTLGEENPAIIPAGKEANSGIATLGREGINPFLWARGFVQPGMDGQTTVSTGSELDVYKERIVKLLDELNGEIIVPRQGAKEAEIPKLAQETLGKLTAQAFSMFQAQSRGFAETGSVAGSALFTNIPVDKSQGEASPIPKVQASHLLDIRFTENVPGIQTQVSITREPGLPVSNQGGEAFLLRKPDGIEEGAFSQAEHSTADLAGTVQRDNPYLQNSTKPVAATSTGQMPVKTENPETNVFAALAASVQNNETDKCLLQNKKPLAATGLDKPTDPSNPGQNAGAATQGVGEKQLSNGKNSGDGIKKQTESGKNTRDERVQNEIPNPKPQGRENTEISFHTGSESTGIGESSSLKHTGTEILNAAKGYSPIWDRIAEAVREHRNSPEVKELQLQLHPAELGKIKVLLNWQDGQVNLQVHASESATGTILQQNLGDLRQALEQAGVSCGFLESGFGGRNGQQREQEFSAATATFTSREEEKQGKVFLPEQAYGSGNVGGKINYMA